MGHRRQDHYGRRAKREGKAARSIYKLEEMDRRFGLIKRGFRVLDLGCAPGSWLQYAAQKVGTTGHVIGYDLPPAHISLPAHAEARVGDVHGLGPQHLGGLFDTVLSDMAPATMGHHKTDALRSAALAESALAIAGVHLKTGGSVVVKVLEGGEVPQITKSMRGDYERVELVRPRATRKESSEIFLIGLRKRAPASGES